MIFPAQEQCNSLPLRNEAIQLINKFTFPARTTQLRMKLLELTIFQLPDSFPCLTASELTMFSGFSYRDLIGVRNLRGPRSVSIDPHYPYDSNTHPRIHLSVCPSTHLPSYCSIQLATYKHKCTHTHIYHLSTHHPHSLVDSSVHRSMPACIPSTSQGLVMASGDQPYGLDRSPCP